MLTQNNQPDSRFKIDSTRIKRYFSELRLKNLDEFSGLKIESVEKTISFTEVVISHNGLINAIGVSDRFKTGDIVDLLQQIDEHEWTIYTKLYFEEGLDINLNPKSTGDNLRLYKISIDEWNPPLHAVSIIYDEKHPFWHIQYIIVPEGNEDDFENIYTFIN